MTSAKLLTARRRLESRMTDTVRVTRTAPGPFDPDTGTYPDVEETIYEGPARLKLASSVVRDVAAQGQNRAEQAPRLDFPVATSAAIRPGDVAEIIASVEDPESVGVTATISGVFYQTFATARRFPVEVQT